MWGSGSLLASLEELQGTSGCPVRTLLCPCCASTAAATLLRPPRELSHLLGSKAWLGYRVNLQAAVSTCSGQLLRQAARPMMAIRLTAVLLST